MSARNLLSATLVSTTLLLAAFGPAAIAGQPRVSSAAAEAAAQANQPRYQIQGQTQRRVIRSIELPATDFGGVYPGGTKALSIELINGGEGDQNDMNYLKVPRLEMSGQAAGDFQFAAPQCGLREITLYGAPIGVRWACFVSIRFNPRAVGTREAVLNAVFSNGASNYTRLAGKGLPTATTGQGQPPPGAKVPTVPMGKALIGGVSYPSFDFGTVRIADFREQMLYVPLVNNQTLQLTEAQFLAAGRLSGPQAGDFELANSVWSTGISGWGALSGRSVRFTPRGNGKRTAVYNYVDWYGVDQTIVLEGNGAGFPVTLQKRGLSSDALIRQR